MRFVKIDENGQQVEAPKLFKVDGKYVKVTPELCLKFGFERVEEDIQQPAEEQQEDQPFDIELEEKDGIIWLPEDLSFEQALDAVRHVTTEAVKDRSNNVKPILQKSSKQKTVEEDIALVQCVFGLDEEQIAACKKAIDLLFMHNIFPVEYVFVEAQDDEADAQFKYVEEKYNAKYIFKKTGPKNKGIFLKHALWTVGAKESKSSKIVFIDTDTSFTNPDWLQNISESLNGFDVSQPFQEIFFADELPDTEEDQYFPCSLKRSFICSLKSGGSKEPQHSKPGHGLAMTRKYFDQIKRLDVLPSNGSDVWFWLKHMDPDIVFKSSLGLPLMADDYDYDLPESRVSYARNIAFHVKHGKRSTRKYDETLYFNKKFCDYVNETLDMSLEIPEFKDTQMAKAHQACVLRCRQSGEDVRKIFDDEAGRLYSKMTGGNKLVFLTCLNTSSGNGLIKDHSIVKAHKYMIDRYCKTPHEYWCITNEKIDGISTIPFELDPDQEIVGWNAQVELLRNLFPGQTVFTIDFDCVPVREFEVFDIEENALYMLNEASCVKQHKHPSLFNAGTMLFKGDMSFIFDDYKRTLKSGIHAWKYFLAVQDFVQYIALSRKVKTQDIRKRVDMLMLKLEKDKVIPPSSKIVKYDFIHYLGQIKPWHKKFFVDNKCLHVMPHEFMQLF